MLRLLQQIIIIQLLVFINYMKNKTTIETLLSASLEENYAYTAYRQRKISKSDFMEEIQRIQGWSPSKSKKLSFNCKNININKFKDKREYFHEHQAKQAEKLDTFKSPVRFILNKKLNEFNNQEISIAQSNIFYKTSEMDQEYLLPSIQAIAKKSETKLDFVKDSKINALNFNSRKQKLAKTLFQQFSEGQRKEKVKNRSLPSKSIRDRQDINLQKKLSHKKQGLLSLISYPMDSFMPKEKSQQLMALRLTNYIRKYTLDPFC